MKTQTNITTALPTIPLSKTDLKEFFVNHLNRIYCAKSHLQKGLPVIKEHAHFTDLTNAVSETLIDVNKQVLRLERIYELLEAEPEIQNCKGVAGLIEDTFSSVYEKPSSVETRDLSILFYLQLIESIEMASFKMLNLVAPQIDKKEVKQLLQESFDEAKEDLALLLMISAKYLQV